LKSLTILGLGSNELSSLPETIGNLKSLTKLDLGLNKLSSLPGSIKRWIEGLEKGGCSVYR